MNIKKIIKKKIKNVFKSLNINKKYKYKIKNNNKYSDVQIYGLLNIAKKENININILIYKIIKKIKKNNIFNKIKYIKSGIINIYLKKKIIQRILNNISKIKNFGIKNKKKKNIVIDYSSPNISKEMHIGHLRSTILGDSISNINTFLGNKVIKINHIGDWGTQFGMIITLIKKNKIEKKIKNIKILEKIYKKSQKLFNKSNSFKNECKKNLLKLQNKDKKIINIWKKITKISINENQKIYNKLKINLNKKNIIGESFYQNKLKKIVKDLIKKKIAYENNKSIIIKNKKKKSIIVIKKSDGAYLYSTIDIASIKYRYKKFKANKLIYLTDTRQKDYIENIFYIAKKAKYIPKNIKLIHYYFGNILNKFGKPFKTRKGYNIKLNTIIKKTIKYTKKKIINKYKKKYNKNIINRISYKIAISAIKYMDLSKNRTKNYVFNFNKILSFKNNTGPYMQYAYIRILSILKKNKTNITNEIKNNKLIINSNIEWIIIKQIINIEQIIKESYKKGITHNICNYLYKLTINFSKLYENENITNIKNIKIKKSKLKIISIIGKIIKICLNILGIPILKYM